MPTEPQVLCRDLRQKARQASTAALGNRPNCIVSGDPVSVVRLTRASAVTANESPRSPRLQRQVSRYAALLISL